MPRPLPSRIKPAAKVLDRRHARESPRARGYDSRWDRMSAAHRRRDPFCAWCRQEGRIEFARLVDHKMPVADGGPMYDPANHWGLCQHHHGLKAEMEAYARARASLHLLQLWCDDPEARPERFRALHTRE